MRKFLTQPAFKKFISGDIKILLILAVVLWIGHYWHSQDFGLYADDYTRIPLGMGISFSELWVLIKEIFILFRGPGRPFHPSLIFFFSFIGGNLGGLNVLYLFGYLFLLINTFLFYKLLKRISGSSFAFMGAMAFCLFPADTTQIYLTHSFGLQPALLFFILASLSYLSNKRLLSYVFIILSILTYETLFPIFLVVPLLGRKWDKSIIREMIGHAIVLTIIFLVDYLLRSLSGGGRLSGLVFPDMITVPLLHMVQGPLVSLGTFFYRPIQTLLSLDTRLIIALGVIFPIAMLLLAQINPDPAFEVISIKDIFHQRSFSYLPENWKKMLKIAITGLMMLILAYPLTFTVRAYALSGRDTRVHFAAVIGASILFASISVIAKNLLKNGWLRHLHTFILSALFTLWIGFGLVVQRDYVLSWQYQRDFWSDIVRLAPDVEDGTVILVDPSGLTDVRQIDANTWNLPRVLGYIYKFPEVWEVVPRVYRLLPGWEKRTGLGESLFQVSDANVVAPSYFYTVVESSQVIIIDTDGDELSRRVEPFLAGGEEYPLKQFDEEQVKRLEIGILFDYFFFAQ